MKLVITVNNCDECPEVGEWGSGRRTCGFDPYNFGRYNKTRIPDTCPYVTDNNKYTNVEVIKE